MTNKQQQILETALELFAKEGFANTSTSKIAKQAKVSEGLIFRHFKNKQGLLAALIKESETKSSTIFYPIIIEENPKQTLKKVIEMPFTIPESEFNFWRLQFKLKWEQGYDSTKKMKPLLDKLTWAFSELAYENPNHEAYLLNNIIESLSISILRDGVNRQEGFKQFLFKKYNI